jgi:hypothetical protein
MNSSPWPSRGWAAAKPLAIALAVSFAVFGLADPGNSQSDSAKAKASAGKSKQARSADLAGSWSGGGRVQFPSGAVEQARCRAHFSRTSANSYWVNATCATASGRAEQTATVRRVGENRYHGSFHNAEYDITGVISITVSGNSQSVRLTSSSANAFLRLSR